MIMTIVEYVGTAIVFIVVVGFLLVMRRAMKAQNKNYSFVDDILLFTGIPVMLGYILFQGFNPHNLGKTAFEVFRTPLTFILLIWLFVSGVLLLIRNPGKKQ